MLRAQGRRRLRLLAVLLGAVLLAAGAYALAHSRLADVDSVEIHGVSAQRAGEAAEAAGVELGTPLVDIDLASVADSVAGLPWVRSAEVRRSWLGSLQVSVDERVPLAVLRTGSGVGVLIDADGVATAPAASASADELPLIEVAPSGSLGDVQEDALPALVVVAAMPDDLAEWVESVTYSRSSGLGLDLVGSAEAKLGDTAHMADKLESLRSVLASVDLRCIELIDVRVADVAAVSRDRGCEAVTG